MREMARVRTKHAELTLEDIGEALPGTGEVMASVSYCFGMCWHAAGGGNWDLAAYYLRRTRKLLRGLVVTRPRYAEQVRRFDSGVLERLYSAIQAHDDAAYETLYEQAVDAAN